MECDRCDAQQRSEQDGFEAVHRQRVRAGDAGQSGTHLSAGRNGEGSGIKDEAVLVGLLDRFEIWNPERYEKVKASDAVMAQEAFKLME